MGNGRSFAWILTSLLAIIAINASGDERATPRNGWGSDANIRKAIEQLQHEKSSVRLTAVSRLLSFPEKAVPAIPQLIKLLGETSALPPRWSWYPWSIPPPGATPPPTPAKTSSRLLAKIGKPAVPKLIDALDAGNPVLCGNAAWVLGQIGDPRALEPLTKLLKSNDTSIRQAVLIAFARAGKWDTLEALRAIRDDEKDKCRDLAIVALGHRKDKQSVDALIKTLKHDDAMLQASSAWALGQIKGPKAIAALIARLKVAPTRPLMRVIVGTKDPGAVDALAGLLKYKDKAIAGRAAFLLHFTNDKRAVLPLIEALKGRDVWVCGSAIISLGKLKDQRAVKPLMELLKENNSRLQKHAIEALGNLKARAAVDLVIPLLVNEKDRPCSLTAHALGQIGDRKAVMPLIACLKYKKPYYVRQPVISALGQLGDPRAIGPLVACLKDVKGPSMSNNRYYYRNIGHCLKQIDAAKSKPHLLGLLGSDDVYWRCAAVSAYRGMGELEPLVESLNDKQARVRRIAIKELGDLGNPSVIPALKKLLQSEKIDYIIADAEYAIKWIEQTARAKAKGL